MKQETTFQTAEAMSIEPTTTVNDASLAALVGVSARRIRQLVESGDLTRHARNEFQLGPALRELLDHAAGDGANGALMRERVRATKAAADLRELEVAKQRGEVAPIEEFAAVQANTAMLIRTNLLNIPARAVLRLLGESDETTFKRVLREEITLALHAAYDSIKSRTKDDLADTEEAPE
jgi:phage terminase Nu1 subunit (DNA packaging protein)